MSERDFTEESFQQFLSEGVLAGSRSRESGRLFVPPRPICPDTYSADMEWVTLSGEGRLETFTAVHIGLSAMIAAGYDRFHPYCSGIVKLVEGPSISAQIIGVDPSAPQSIAIGTPLRAVFVRRGEEEQERAYLAFTAEGGQEESRGEQ